MTRRLIRFYEALAGRLIVRAARLRMARLGPDDAHEVRHLYAALRAGASDSCDVGGANCHLDQVALDGWDAAQAWLPRTYIEHGENA